MTQRMYDVDELMSAQDALGTIVDALPDTLVLLGDGPYTIPSTIPTCGSTGSRTWARGTSTWDFT